MHKFILVIVLCCLVGCVKMEKRSFKISIVRPDGGIHKSYIIESSITPHSYSLDSGHSRLIGGEKDELIPVGWMIDIEPLMENNYEN